MDETHSTLLVRLADHADEDAWRTFHELYGPLLARYAAKRGLSAADADDVAQDCARAVLDHIDRFCHRGPGSFRAWLHTIAENKIRNIYRRRRRERRVKESHLERHADPRTGSVELWERHWMAEHVRYCLKEVRGQIASHTYEAFHRNVIDEEPAVRVAEELGLSANQVYVAKFRVLERVRSLLRDLTGSVDGASQP